MTSERWVYRGGIRLRIETRLVGDGGTWPHHPPETVRVEEEITLAEAQAACPSCGWTNWIPAFNVPACPNCNTVEAARLMLWDRASSPAEKLFALMTLAERGADPKARPATRRYP